MRSLVLGAGGMLGGAFRRVLGPEAVTVSRNDLDPAAIGAVHALIADAGAELVVNCAAHTDVEGAEDDPDPAYAANAVLPGILSTACRRIGATLVHVSSTGCYGGTGNGAHVEDDPLYPTSVHHRSKAAGEQAVRDAGAEHLIVRTGWLFGGAPGAPRNFVWNRLVEALRTDEMVSDPFQEGCPTWVDDVARQTLRAVNEGCRGTINVVSQGRATRHDYVARIIEAAGLPCAVRASVTPFARRAPVSANETAVNARLRQLGLDAMPHWQEAVDGYVGALTATPAWQRLKDGA